MSYSQPQRHRECCFSSVDSLTYRLTSFAPHWVRSSDSLELLQSTWNVILNPHNLHNNYSCPLKCCYNENSTDMTNSLSHIFLSSAFLSECLWLNGHCERLFAKLHWRIEALLSATLSGTLPEWWWLPWRRRRRASDWLRGGTTSCHWNVNLSGVWWNFQASSQLSGTSEPKPRCHDYRTLVLYNSASPLIIRGWSREASGDRCPVA